MKTKFNLFIYLMTIALVLGSCKKDALDDLKGIYTPPEIIDYTILDSQTRDKDGALFIFSVNLKDNASNTLNMRFVSTEFALSTSDYTPSETAVDKTYLNGSEGSTCNGQQFTGTISLSVDDSGNYSLEGILHLADGTVVRMTGAFSVVYEYIPAYTYSIEVENPTYGGIYGNELIAGASKFKISLFADGLKTANIEVIADETATSLSGTYPITDPLSGTNQAAAGYYLDLSWPGWGTGVVTGGCYYKESGEFQYIRGGEITIVDNGTSMSISGTDLALQDIEATAEVYPATYSYPTSEETGSVTIEDAKIVLLQSAVIGDLTAYGAGYSVDIVISVGVTTGWDPVNYVTTYNGTGDVITLNFTMDADTLLPGTFMIVENTAATAGDCVAGYLHEYGFDAGSRITPVIDGIAGTTAYIQTGGSVELEYDEITGTYNILFAITTDNGSQVITYKGPINFSHVTY